MSLSLRHRIRILSRDGYRCVYCGQTSKETRLEVDHIVARARGGSSEDANLITACRECNQGKSAEPLPLPDYVQIEPSRGRDWLAAVDRAFPFDRDCYDPIVTYGRFAAVSWCAGLIVRCRNDRKQARITLKNLRLACDHACIDDHELVDVALSRVPAPGPELARGRRRADHFQTCVACITNVGPTAAGAALQRARDRIQPV